MPDLQGLDRAPGIEDLRARVRILCERWLGEGRYVPRNDCWVRSFDAEFSRELGQEGLIGVNWPTRYGGAGLGNRARLAVSEELLRFGAPVAAHWIGDRQIGPAVLRFGTEKLKQDLLPVIASGQAVCALGMSEPEAGSDLSSVRTQAEPVAGGFRLNGRKIWTSFAHRATHLYVLARTSRGERKHQGLSEFVIDMGSDGVSCTPIIDMSGEHHFNEVMLDDVFVPAERLLGQEGDGWRQVVEQLSLERGGPERFLSTYPLLTEALPRVEGSRSEEELGRLAADFLVLRTMASRIAETIDAGGIPITQAATLKLLGSYFEPGVIEFARRNGLAETVESRSSFIDALLASPGFSIRGGSADVLLHIISRETSGGG